VTGGEAFDRRTAVEIAEAAQRLGVRVAVAESLTGGLLTARLAEAPEASTWLRGGVVAYHAEVKYHVLGVDPGPVVTAWAARQMARGVARLLGADVGISVTGVGGPDEEEGQPPGTVWLGLWTKNRLFAYRKCFDSDPGEVCRLTCDAALGLLLNHLQST
jgi:nicotinamide-nucleotide amidase